MKKITTTLLGLSMAIAVQAQADLLSALSADFERGKTMTLDYLNAMPEDKFAFSPIDGTRTFSEQMLHLSQGTIGLVSNGTGAAKIFDGQNLEKEASLQSKSEVIRVVTESFDFAIKSISEMDESKLNDIVERGPFKVTRMGWIMKAHEHMSHHKGQCAVYLRLSGITPPKYKLF